MTMFNSKLLVITRGYYVWNIRIDGMKYGYYI